MLFDFHSTTPIAGWREVGATFSVTVQDEEMECGCKPATNYCLCLHFWWISFYIQVDRQK